MTTQAFESATTARARYLEYTGAIEKLCRENPGARGALRSGLRRDIDHQRAQPMHKWLSTRIPENSSRTTVQAHYTIAALIAAQPRHSFARQEPEPAAEKEGQQETPDPKAAGSSTSFGRTLGDAASAGALRYSAAESRITLLTRQSVRGIHLHLPSPVHQVRTGGIPVDWARLLADLINWPYRSGRIVRLWLQDFYQTTAGLAED